MKPHRILPAILGALAGLALTIFAIYLLAIQAGPGTP
jgi:hypothetical protein